MSYEIKTPLIAESVDALRYAIDGIKTGALDARPAGVIISGAKGLQSAIGIDIKARLADPKIRLAEAKLVETEQHKQIAA